ncbi:Ankyrin repeat containing protein [Apiospora arundinis]
MVGHKRQDNDLKWESFRPEIERKFVAGKQTLDQIVTWLGEQGFPVSKNQLNYRLNTVWRLRRRAPKGKAPEFWRSVGQLPGLIGPPENGSGASSLALIHNQRRQRIRPSNLARQTKRYNNDTPSSHPYLTSQLPGSLQVAKRSPTPERASLPWPQDLPWLVSKLQRLESLYYTNPSELAVAC